MRIKLISLSLFVALAGWTVFGQRAMFFSSNTVAAPLTPPTTGLLARYRADSVAGGDGATVTTWPDTSGNGYDATGTGSPVLKLNIINGQPIVRFAGSQYVTSTVASTNANNSGVYLLSKSSSPSSFQTLAMFGTSNDAFYNQSSSAYRINAAVGGSVPSTFLLNGYSSGRDVNASITFFRGQQQAEGKAQGVTTNTQTSFRLAGYTSGGFTWAGDIAEAFVYSPPLSVKDYNQLASYASQRYGLSLSLVGQVVFDGNSLTAGNGAADAIPGGFPYPTITGLTGDWAGTNHGIPSITTTTMISNAPTQVDPLYGAALGKNILVFWEVTNELYNGLSAAAAYANAVTYVTARQAAGWKVVALTVLPRSNAGTPGGFEANRQTVNTSMRTTMLTDCPGVVIADVGGDATIGPFGASDNATYYADKVHLTQTGYNIVYPYVVTAVSTF